MLVKSNNHILSEVQYFRGLDQEVLEFIEEHSKIKHYEKGSYLFHTEDKCEKLYIVKEGLIKVFLIGENGKEVTLHIVGSGKIMGDTILFNGEPYGANACALTDSELIIIENKTFERIISRYPEIGIRMLSDFGKRIKKMMMLVGEMVLNDVKTRLIRFVIELAQETGIKHDGKIVINTVLTQDEMASIIGTKREVLCRELHKLEKEKLLTVNRGKITIHDFVSLRKKVLEIRETVFPTKDNGIVNTGLNEIFPHHPL